MSSGGETRVSIPDNVKLTIQNIRDMTEKQHSDDEIYAMLRDCSMDPNETIGKMGPTTFANRGPMSSPVKPVQKTKNIVAAPGTKASTSAPNGLKNLRNGCSLQAGPPLARPPEA
ncbi:hypothetical protein TB2_031563 [Malus domestica]